MMYQKRFCAVRIVSFGVRCAELNLPGVYTRIANHID